MDWATGGGTELPHHFLSGTNQPWAVAHDGAICVRQPESFVLYQLRHTSQQVHAVGALPAFVLVGEVRSEITQARCSEHCVGDRVGDNVGVTMTGQPVLARKPHPTEHEHARLVGGVPVHIVPDPYASTHSGFTTVGIGAFPGPSATAEDP